MKVLSIMALAIGALCALPAQAKPASCFLMDSEHCFNPADYQGIGLDLRDVKLHPALNQHAMRLLTPQISWGNNPLSRFETKLPHSTQADVSHFERSILAAFLDNPNDLTLAKFLAVYHYAQAIGLSRFEPAAVQGKRISHAVLAEYFLNRARDIGGRNEWVNAALKNNKQLLDRFFASGNPLDPVENHPAHLFFIDAFNYKEGNRYKALDKLLEDMVVNPNNALTNAYLSTVNLWIGSEAEYEDSTMLYNYIWASYFGVRVTNIAKQREEAWKANPAVPRFRHASSVGGWTVPPRRWLAQLVKDQKAVDALDDEHRAWRPHYRVFYALTISTTFFTENNHFMEGFDALMDGFAHCDEIPDLTSCPDQPLVSHNILSFQATAADFLLKAGNVDAARDMLSNRTYPPFNYQDFTLGQAAWEHREQNLEAIAALYQNNPDPKNTPPNFLMKRQKWGADMTTCQTCHQAQGSKWTEAEKNSRPVKHESVRTVNNWPAMTTTWYGRSR